MGAGETDGAEHCTHPLARGYESIGRIEQFVGGGAQVGPSASMSVYHLNEPDADSGAHRPKGRGETIHGDQRNWAEPGRTRSNPAELGGAAGGVPDAAAMAVGINAIVGGLPAASATNVRQRVSASPTRPALAPS